MYFWWPVYFSIADMLIAEIRHELFEIPIVSAELFISGSSAQHIPDAIEDKVVPFHLHGHTSR
jgi:hypothetical protein